MFDTEGMAPSFDAITLERAVRSTGVSRSSAYNIWSEAEGDHSPQEAFQWEVIKRLVAQATAAQMVFAFAGTGFETLESGLEGTELRRELIRRAANAYWADLDARRSNRIVCALLASANTVPKDMVDDRLLGWLREDEATISEALIAEAIRPLITALNLVPRPEFDADQVWSQFATVLMSVGDGLISRSRIVSGDILERVLPATGDADGWSLYAIAVEALVDRFFVEA